MNLTNKKKLTYCAITLALVTALAVAPAASAEEVSGRVYATCNPHPGEIVVDCEFLVGSSVIPVDVGNAEEEEAEP